MPTAGSFCESPILGLLNTPLHVLGVFVANLFGTCSAHDCQDTDGHFDGLSPGWSNLIVNNANDGVSSYWCSDW